MVTANFKGVATAQTDVTQWDYGQNIKLNGAPIDIPDGTEAQFYQGNLSHTDFISDNICPIPDVMLQNPCGITMYIYVRDGTSGTTVLSVNIGVARRPRPEGYILPAYDGYKRLIPDGGAKGQVLVKQSDSDYDVIWQEVEGSNVQAMTNEEVDEACK